MLDRRDYLSAPHTWGEYGLCGVAGRLFFLARRLAGHWATRPLARWLQELFLLMHGPVVDLTLWGLRLRLFAEGNLSEKRALFTIHRLDPRERAFIRSALRAGDVFLDVGANAGMYSYWAAGGPEGVRVLAFEPHPVLAAQCRFNVETNDLTRVSVHEVALGEEASVVSLQTPAENLGQSSVGGPGRGEARGVPVRQLSEILHEEGVDRVRCMKIDIEGGEAAVLRELFANAPPEAWPQHILIETLGEARRDAATVLESHGYELAVRWRMNSLYSRSPTRASAC